MKPTTYEELRRETLCDFETALLYLQEALKENDVKEFLSAFGYVVEAQGGAGKFAEKTHLSRQSIYNAMKNKSLRADSLFDIVRGLGLKFELVPLTVKKTAKRKAARAKAGV